MKIVHVISGLEVGGAERMLERLVRAMKVESPQVTHTIVSLADAGTIGRQLRHEGIEVIALNLGQFWALPLAVLRMTVVLRRLEPDIVQGWMYRADFISALACLFVKRPRLIWGIRCVEIPRTSSIAVKLLIRINAMLSHSLPEVIVCCAEAARNFHASIGYSRTKMLVIPNGFDFELFRPDAADRLEVRKELGFDEDDVVVGIAGRYDELKDYENFTAAAGRAVKENSQLKFVMIGRGLDTTNQALSDMISANGLQGCTVLVGESNSVPRLMRCMDIYCMSSISEGFPNVVVEAMATALPCVVTDVGDAALIIADCGVVVPPRNPERLAEGLVRLSLEPRNRLRQLGDKARSSSKARFSISTAVKEYNQTYEKVIGKTHNG